MTNDNDSKPVYLDIVLVDNGPDSEFIELEDPSGASVRAGRTLPSETDANGYRRIRLRAADFDVSAVHADALRRAARAVRETIATSTATNPDSAYHRLAGTVLETVARVFEEQAVRMSIPPMPAPFSGPSRGTARSIADALLAQGDVPVEQSAPVVDREALAAVLNPRAFDPEALKADLDEGDIFGEKLDRERFEQIVHARFERDKGIARREADRIIASGVVRDAAQVRRDEANLIANLIAKAAPHNMELRPDGSEDPLAAAYVDGVHAAHDVARERQNSHGIAAIREQRS